jgi:hypothetical protein
VAPEALIRFTRTNGAGAAFGDLYFRGERLMPFQEGQSQGYGSHWWSTGAEDALPGGGVCGNRGGQRLSHG